MITNIAVDIAVIGAGTGGYVAAIRAAQLGATVVIIEKDVVGGTCLNRGCIPKKSFVHAAKLYTEFKEAKKFGITFSDLRYNFEEIQKRKQQVVTRITKGVEFLLKSRNIQLLRGKGEFVDAKTIRVTSTTNAEYEISAKKIIIATGSKALIPASIPGISGKNVITSDDVLNFTIVPKSMIIIGGGAISCEFAAIFNGFGTKITIIEMMPTLIPAEDQEIAHELENQFKRKKIDVFTSCKVTNITEDVNESKKVHYTDLTGEHFVIGEFVLVAIGRVPFFDGLQLEKAGIIRGKRGILINEYLETNISGIYAIGDVVEGQSIPMRASVAAETGIIAAENALGKNRQHDCGCITSCIFAEPEIGSVGLTEMKAIEKFTKVLIGKFPYRGLGRAVISDDTDGFVKLIVHPESHIILGVHIIGTHATEVIAEAALAVRNKMKVEQLIDTEHAHPVFYEIIREAALDALGRAIHK